jgi:hypothetical protein
MAEPRPVLGASCPSPGAERAGPAGASSLERCDVAAVTSEPLTPPACRLLAARSVRVISARRWVGTSHLRGLASVRLLYSRAVPAAAASLSVIGPLGRASDLPVVATDPARRRRRFRSRIVSCSRERACSSGTPRQSGTACGEQTARSRHLASSRFPGAPVANLSRLTPAKARLHTVSTRPTRFLTPP